MVRYYRTWCGTYSSELPLVLLGWLRLLVKPHCWEKAASMQEIEGWAGLTFKWKPMRCECPPPGGGLCFPCHMNRTVASTPYNDSRYESC